jgi:hypothetical protein
MRSSFLLSQLFLPFIIVPRKIKVQILISQSTHHLGGRGTILGDRNAFV